jgi:AraC-like DNA-binding protein
MNLDSTVILSISRCKYKEQHYVDNHCHNFYHLLYITGGQGTLGINNVERKPAVDEVYVIPPGVYHEICSDLDAPLRTLEMKFMIGEPKLDALLQPVPLPFRSHSPFIRSMLEEMLREALNKMPLYKEMIFSRGLHLLFHIARLHSGASGDAAAAHRPENAPYLDVHTEAYLLAEPDPDKGNALAEQVLQYIHEHFCEQLSLSQLAERFAVSQSHLSKVFSHRFDISPIQYVNQLKLQKVKHLLVHSNMSITEISDRVGFGSIHYLSHYFSQRERMSPSEYRSRFRGTVHIPVEETYRIVNRNAVMI